MLSMQKKDNMGQASSDPTVLEFLERQWEFLWIDFIVD